MKFSFENLRGTMKNTSIILIAVIAAVMISSALAVTVTTTAFAYLPISNRAVVDASINHANHGHNSGSARNP
jgi:hypothetical protein